MRMYPHLLLPHRETIMFQALGVFVYFDHVMFHTEACHTQVMDMECEPVLLRLRLLYIDAG